MSQDSLNRIADELEAIRNLLENFLVVPLPPSPPEKKLGAESIQYLSEDEIVEMEDEELRQTLLGRIPNQIRD